MRYSFQVPGHAVERSSITYSRIAESPGGLLVTQVLGQTTVEISNQRLILPDQGLREVHINLPEYNNGRPTSISWPCRNEMITVNSLDDLVSRATTVWRALLTNQTVTSARAEFHEIRRPEDGSLVVNAPEESSAAVFHSYVASPDEIQALEQIARHIVPPQSLVMAGTYI